MSCLGPNYLITTTPPWYRRRTVCTDPGNIINRNEDGTIYVPILKKKILITELYDEFAMYKKGNVLQHSYKHQTNKLTKNQIYALLAKKKWITRKNFATQSETYTNPNSSFLKRVNYDVINAETGAQTTESITCPTFIPQPTPTVLPPNNNTPSVIPNILPPPPPTPSKHKFTLPDIKPVVDTPQNINIADGGSLVIGVIEDICTGKRKITCDFSPIVCFPSSYSDVPRINGVDKELCYTKGSRTWITKSGINTSRSI
uniref:Uncharacterized protein n=1 Tax=viral metagenome TaxID=1070528 RepID=A0A6C0E482_9ZZZZ